MSTDIKEIVSKEETFDRLDIRLGRVIAVEPAPDAPRPAYKIAVDFGRFGVKTTVGRFTRHPPDELMGQLVMGVLNFPTRPVGGVLSEFLLLGVQYPKADSGEATFITPAAPAKIGSKLF
ncbi:MAG: tRNA-binding protein [Rhodospirillaceae bacterium]|nr:tRNA-binding protein [Rhodospirillaceae bacterium]